MVSILSLVQIFIHVFLMLVLVGNAQNRQEQRVCIKFMSSLGMKAACIRQHLLNVHGVLTYSLSTIHHWIRKFRVGGDVTYARRSGRPTKLTTAKIAQIRAIVRCRPNASIQFIVLQTQLSVTTVHKALRKVMNLKKRPCHWVTHFLNANQKNRRMQAAWALLRTSRQPNFFNRIITGDESWCINYDPASRALTMTWLLTGERRPPKTQMQRNALKVMIIIFWDSASVIFKEFVLRGQGITAAYYLGVMRRLREAIRR